MQSRTAIMLVLGFIALTVAFCTVTSPADAQSRYSQYGRGPVIHRYYSPGPPPYSYVYQQYYQYYSPYRYYGYAQPGYGFQFYYGPSYGSSRDYYGYYPRYPGRYYYGR